MILYQTPCMQLPETYFKFTKEGSKTNYLQTDINKLEDLVLYCLPVTKE